VEVDVVDVAYRIIGGGEDGDKTLVFRKEDADHSFPYLIAVALLDRAVMPAQLVPRRVLRADVQALLCRVVVRPLAEYSSRFPNEMPSRVTVTLADGRVLARALADYPGFHTRPQTWEGAVQKFTTLAARRVANTALTDIAGAVHELDHIAVAELTRLLGSVGTPTHGATRHAA
jgi:2-methylcitrate dehydratase